jgi:putative lipoic acid-binding regulatory protein
MSNESLLQFPCSFAIKAMGKSTIEFDMLVTDIINRHVEKLSQDQISTKKSKDGNYVSVTVTIQATGKDQLDAIYRELSAHPNVLMAL